MNFNGNEIVYLYAKEDNGESKFTISFIKLDQLINSYILNKMLDELKQKTTNTKFNVETFTIEGLNIKKGTKVKLRFKVTLKETIPILKDLEYETIIELDIIEFYNYIIELFEGYAYELDTNIDNIRIELIELETV